MNQPERKSSGMVGSLGVAAVLSVALTAAPARAGGLVDTSTERFVAADFTNSSVIDNPWWTLPAGSNFLYLAHDGEDCAWTLTQVLGTTGPSFFVAYAGTDARIVLDRGWVDEGCEYEDDFQAFIASGAEAEEVTYDWFAQDDEQNIWYMGEDTFDGDTSGSFVAGCDGAEAGIVILGDPAKGDFHSQEFYEGEAEDWGKVLTFKRMDGQLCMKTKEWSPLEHGAIEQKWYCSDGTVGQLVRTESLHGKTVVEDLVDTNIAPTPPVGGLPISPVPTCP